MDLGVQKSVTRENLAWIRLVYSLAQGVMSGRQNIVTSSWYELELLSITLMAANIAATCLPARTRHIKKRLRDQTETRE